MSAVFVTATGTDIGKTFITTGLIRYLRGTGRAVHAIKPVVTGFAPDAWSDSDPAALLAALAALDVIEQQPDYAALPLAKARAFARGAWLPEPQSPIVPVVLGEAEAALAASALLEENGFLVIAIRPPTVPTGTARLRLTFTAQHPDDEIERLAEIVRTRILVRSGAMAIPAQ